MVRSLYKKAREHCEAHHICKVVWIPVTATSLLADSLLSLFTLSIGFSWKEELYKFLVGSLAAVETPPGNTLHSATLEPAPQVSVRPSVRICDLASILIWPLLKNSSTNPRLLLELGYYTDKYSSIWHDGEA